MTRLRISVAAALLALASMAVSVAAQDSGKKTLTGVVTDTMCGAKHMMKDKSAAECTRLCVKQGMDYGLLVGDKVYTLKGNTAAIDKLAGERATVTGTVSGNDVKVDTIRPAGGKAS
jgi:type 1 fimbria pilin